MFDFKHFKHRFSGGLHSDESTSCHIIYQSHTDPYCFFRQLHFELMLVLLKKKKSIFMFLYLFSDK